MRGSESSVSEMGGRFQSEGSQESCSSKPVRLY